jgi:hypothetical protein
VLPPVWTLNFCFLVWRLVAAPQITAYAHNVQTRSVMHEGAASARIRQGLCGSEAQELKFGNGVL